MLAKRICSYMLALSLLLISNIAAAQSITLYEQPNQTSKVVGTADLATGIIPIFTPETNKDWIKVADPRNGNVGWIKSSDIKDAKGSESSVTFTQKIINDGKPNNNTFHIIQFGNAPKLTNEQAQQMMQKFRTEQQQIQDSLQGAMKNINELIKREWDLWNSQGGFPMIIMPTPNDKQTTTATPAVPATPAKQTK